MTILPDDGLLTDDPVVASCFLGCSIVDGIDDFLDSVGTVTVGLCDAEGFESTTGYPIRIPAAMVAEVCGFGHWKGEPDLYAFHNRHETYVLLAAAKLGRGRLESWLRTHVQENPDHQQDNILDGSAG